LEELYYKSNKYNTIRRSWHLPIAPTPDHPDATNRKTRKRFPTLVLANGAALKSNSYVNVRYVYEINWSLLRLYTPLDMPNMEDSRFELESLIRMLHKSKLVCEYEPGQQFSNGVVMDSPAAEPIRASTEDMATGDESEPDDETFKAGLSSVQPAISNHAQSDFWLTSSIGYRVIGPFPEIPPDTEVKSTINSSRRRIVGFPFDRMLSQAGDGVEGMLIRRSFDPALRRPMGQFWVDAKGVMAVFIASV